MPSRLNLVPTGHWRVIEPAEPKFDTRPVESWVGPHHLYVEGREPLTSPGLPERPAILFTGGAFDGSWIFRREMDYLAARGWRVYALNPRGYYKSRWNDVAALNLEDYLEDIRAVREGLKLDRVILAGYSMGGLLSLKHAERHGADGLILYDSDPSKEIWEAIGRRPHRTRVPPVVRFWPSHPIVQEMWGGRISRRRYFEFLELFKQTAISGRSYRLTEYGGVSVNTWKIRMPALIIGIKRDEEVQAEWFRRLHSTWLVFEGNSHGSILVGPKSSAIIVEVARWLESVFDGGQNTPHLKKIFPVLGYFSRNADLFRMKLGYFSGWQYPEIEIRTPGRTPDVRVKMDRIGPGRVEGEHLHEATFVLNRRAGFFIREGQAEDHPPGGGLYKPLAKELFLADGEFFPEWPPSQRSKSVYIDMNLHSDDLQHLFRIHLLLPRDYRKDARPYPVCVLNDGQNQWKNQGALGGWHTDVITAARAKKGRGQDVVLVSVESTRLHRNKYYLTPPIGRADLYVNFLADLLLPRLRQDFNLSTHREEIGIVGASYGANCAVYAGMKRPDVFGLIGSLSYAPLKGRPLRTWMQGLTHLPFNKWYLDCGTKWTPDQKNNRTDNTRTTIELSRLAQNKGMIPGRNLFTLVAQGHCHQEPFWRKRIGKCMEFLFPLI